MIAVVGAQYGSEGKGNIVDAMIRNGVKGAAHVRTGGPNAGHTIYYNGEAYKMQVIPCGWVDPTAVMVIGRGAVVDIGQLKKEVKMLDELGINTGRIIVDEEASILDDTHKESEGGTKGDDHQRIGSTGKGVGACRRDRMRRIQGGGHTLAKDNEWLINRGMLTDTVGYLHSMHQMGGTILLEGTQGTGLSLIHGYWPYVTTADVTAGQFMVDAGLHPRMLDEVVLVARTFPIRVAGNSGPLSGELTWDDISKQVGREIEERTTVTNKVRRIGMWDEIEFIKACRLNGPTQIAINFLDYLSPEDEGIAKYEDLTVRSQQFVEYVERVADCPVTMVGTGGEECQVIVK